MTTSARRRGWRAIGGLRGWVPLAVLLLAWQFLGDPHSVPFPRPRTWLSGLDRLYDSGQLVRSAKVTLQTFVASIVLATILGAALGYLIGTVTRADRALTPVLDFFRTLPAPAVVPVAALLLGPTLRASIAIVVFAIVWPILLNTVAATRGIPPTRHDAARTLGLGSWGRLSRVIVPSLVPGILMGVRIAVSVSLVVTLLVDTIGHGAGLGRLLLDRQARFDTQAVWGLLALIGVMGYLFNAALNLLARRLPWSTEAAEARLR